MIKDYYQILGVESGVDEDALKKAYRDLAQQWHPDKNPDSAEEAEEKFKEISEAYSVLSDPEKRRSYDLTGSPNGSSGGFKATGDPFSMFFGGRSPFGHAHQANPPMQGQSIQVPLEVTVADALFGAQMSLEYDLQSGCAACNGRGGTEFEMCDPCQGRGFLQVQQGSMFMQRGCDNCQAQGQVVKTPCEPCKGKGVIPERKGINLVIPEGVKHGNTMRLAGQGGAGFNGGPPGDVMVIVQLNYPDVSSLSDEDKEKLKELLSK